jgi:site-specific DNA-cytosine methylase
MGAKTGLYGIVNDKGNLREVEQATCLDANYWKGCDNHAQRTMIYLSNTNANMKQRIQDRKETWTLGTGTDFGIKDGMRIRKLTPIECERLQGFPDNWTQNSEVIMRNGKNIRLKII